MSNPLNLPEGIHIRSNSLAIDFRYRGQRCRETLKNLPVSKSNIKFAERKRSAILLEIARGTFDYAQHFPDSSRAAIFSGSLAEYKTIGAALTEWLTIIEQNVTPHTFRGYKNAAEKYVRPAFGELPLGRLTRTHILNWIATDLQGLAPTTINAKLLPLKAVVKNALADRILTHDPLVDVRPPEADYEEPDPFTKTEIDALMTVDTHRRSEQHMVQFALWSGLRPGELIALAWEDIDWVHGTVHVRRALSRDGYKIPKTRRSLRQVELLTPAREALQDQRALTEVRPPISISVRQRDNRRSRPESVRFIFTNTLTGGPFPDVSVYREGFWNGLLKKAKVRQRGCKTTRHTFISQMLTAGMPKEWIMRQVGHTSSRTIDDHYGKWIREDALNMADIANEKFGFGHKRVTRNSENEKTGDDSAG